MYSEDEINKVYPYSYNMWSGFNEAVSKRLEMVEFKKPFAKNPGYEHPNSRYYSTSLNSMLKSINSTVTDIEGSLSEVV
ncbi:2824_t:CDS:2 [Diversispora eburnea]|uniref:2824_t:CDS:1 n=1 Tax=Diversispora eburnea TaxID=1213867 RepID=A0A9N8ZZB5_9GLOM|nr:2824_t:CDS:2 [Diversispora eburnea]